jgi:hypothetical protein
VTTLPLIDVFGLSDLKTHQLLKSCVSIGITMMEVIFRTYSFLKKEKHSTLLY